MPREDEVTILLMNLIERLYRTVSRSRWESPPRLLVDRFVAKIAQELATGSWILDAGAGECIYASAFCHCNYISCDQAIGDPSWNYRRVTVVGDLASLPFRECAFDAVLCTQTLEHVSEPQLVVREMAMLLKPGGRLYLTVPFLGDPLHQEPYDFYRYTKYSLKRLVENAG
jgi:SAM-dependent methyltransferase